MAGGGTEMLAKDGIPPVRNKCCKLLACVLRARRDLPHAGISCGVLLCPFPPLSSQVLKWISCPLCFQHFHPRRGARREGEAVGAEVVAD